MRKRPKDCGCSLCTGIHARGYPIIDLRAPRGPAKPDLSDDYTVSDISSESYREIHLADGRVYRIEKPVWLVIRKGGSTHRVIDADGKTHCYAAPESGKTVLTWKSKPGVSF